MAFEEFSPGGAEKKDPVDILRDKVMATAVERREKTLTYFKRTGKSLDDFVQELAMEPFKIAINPNDPQSLADGIFQLQHDVLKFPLNLDTNGCDGICGAFTFKEFKKTQIAFRKKSERGELKSTFINPQQHKEGESVLPSEEVRAPGDEYGEFASFLIGSGEERTKILQTKADEMEEMKKDPHWKENFLNKGGFFAFYGMKLLDDPHVRIDPEIREFLKRWQKFSRDLEAQLKAIVKKLFPETLEAFSSDIQKVPDWKSHIDELMKTKESSMKLFLLFLVQQKNPGLKLLSPEMVEYLRMKIVSQEDALKKELLQPIEELYKKTFPELDWAFLKFDKTDFFG